MKSLLILSKFRARTLKAIESNGVNRIMLKKLYQLYMFCVKELSTCKYLDHQIHKKWALVQIRLDFRSAKIQTPRAYDTDWYQYIYQPSIILLSLFKNENNLFSPQFPFLDVRCHPYQWYFKSDVIITTTKNIEI